MTPAFSVASALIGPAIGRQRDAEYMLCGYVGICFFFGLKANWAEAAPRKPESAIQPDSEHFVEFDSLVSLFGNKLFTRSTEDDGAEILLAINDDVAVIAVGWDVVY